MKQTPKIGNTTRRISVCDRPQAHFCRQKTSKIVNNKKEVESEKERVELEKRRLAQLFSEKHTLEMELRYQRSHSKEQSRYAEALKAQLRDRDLKLLNSSLTTVKAVPLRTKVLELNNILI
jgi:hypothetical protein